MKHSFLVLFALVLNQAAQASETWAPAPVLGMISAVINVKGKFLTEAEKTQTIADCVNTLKTDHPGFRTECSTAFGEYRDQGDAKTSLLGTHVSCQMTCTAPPVPAGRCVVRKYIDQNGVLAHPFVLLQTENPYYGIRRIILDGKVSDMGAVAELIRFAHADARAKCE